MFNGKLEIEMSLFGNKDEVTLEIHDSISGQLFLDVKFTPADFVEMFSGRLAHKRLNAYIFHLERVGKKMEMDCIEFKMPKGVNWKDKEDVARKEALNYIPEGWVADTYYRSQGSFFQKDGVEYARTTIRRWVQAPKGEVND